MLAHERGPKSSLMPEPDCFLDRLRDRHLFPRLHHCPVHLGGMHTGVCNVKELACRCM